MQDLAELERRIVAAFGRIGDGIAALGATKGAEPSEVEDIAALRADLESERRARAALQDRLDALADARTVANGSSDETVDRLTRQLDVQGIEMVRLRKTVGTLRENLRALRAAQAAGVPDPAAINRAMLAELEAMRAERLSEMAELDEIIAELDPLIGPDSASSAEETREDA